MSYAQCSYAFASPSSTRLLSATGYRYRVFCIPGRWHALDSTNPRQFLPGEQCLPLTTQTTPSWTNLTKPMRTTTSEVRPLPCLRQRDLTTLRRVEGPPSADPITLCRASVPTEGTLQAQNPPPKSYWPSPKRRESCILLQICYVDSTVTPSGCRPVGLAGRN